MKTKLLLYCTKNPNRLIFDALSQKYAIIESNKNLSNTLNGKIVAECECEVEEKYRKE